MFCTYLNPKTECAIGRAKSVLGETLVESAVRYPRPSHLSRFHLHPPHCNFVQLYYHSDILTTSRLRFCLSNMVQLFVVIIKYHHLYLHHPHHQPTALLPLQLGPVLGPLKLKRLVATGSAIENCPTARLNSHLEQTVKRDFNNETNWGIFPVLYSPLIDQ